MSIDTFLVYVGVNRDLHAVEVDYERVKDLHSQSGLLDAYDAAVVAKRDDGKVKIEHKHESLHAWEGFSAAGRARPLVW